MLRNECSEKMSFWFNTLEFSKDLSNEIKADALSYEISVERCAKKKME